MTWSRMGNECHHAARERLAYEVDMRTIKPKERTSVQEESLTQKTQL